MKSDASSTAIWLVVVGMAALNFAVRFIPLAVVSRVELPKPLARWLSFVPICVMGALVAREVLLPGEQWTNPFTGPHLYAAVLTGIVFYKTRSFLGATIAGMASFVALQQLIRLLGG